MTVSFLLNNGFEAVTVCDAERKINGVYIGDLLSWVMSSAKENNAWVTIMNNLNVVAVASLTDVACVILAEGVTLDDEVKKVAQEKGLNVLSSSKTAYEIAITLSGIGL